MSLGCTIGLSASATTGFLAATALATRAAGLAVAGLAVALGVTTLLGVGFTLGDVTAGVGVATGLVTAVVGLLQHD